MAWFGGSAVSTSGTDGDNGTHQLIATPASGVTTDTPGTTNPRSGSRGSTGRTNVELFAGDAVLVAVQLCSVAGLPPPQRCGARGPGGSTVGEVDAGARRLGHSRRGGRRFRCHGRRRYRCRRRGRHDRGRRRRRCGGRLRRGRKRRRHGCRRRRRRVSGGCHRCARCCNCLAAPTRPTARGVGNPRVSEDADRAVRMKGCCLDSTGSTSDIRGATTITTPLGSSTGWRRPEHGTSSTSVAAQATSWPGCVTTSRP